MRLAPVFRVDETTRKEKAANVDRVINNQVKIPVELPK